MLPMRSVTAKKHDATLEDADEQLQCDRWGQPSVKLIVIGGERGGGTLDTDECLSHRFREVFVGGGDALVYLMYASTNCSNAGERPW